MAFWGVEVKPGKPYHHLHDKRGRLHVSQATLVSDSSSKRTIVQCSIGKKKAIYLCSLLPEKNETCPLNLEFEELDEVQFSVIGSHSVHLSGFFYSEAQDNFEHDYGFDSYEEDIGETESDGEESTDYDTEEEKDFSDDGIDMFPPSPVPNSGVRIEEIVDDEKPSNENDASQRPKKKKNKSDDNDNTHRQLVVKNGTSVSVMESEDEDGFPVSSPGKTKANGLNNEEKTEEIKDAKTDKGTKKKEKDDFASNISVKRKIHAVDSSATTSELVNDTDDKQTKKKKKKKSKGNEEKIHETASCSKTDIQPEDETTRDVDQTVAVETENEVIVSSVKEKKKKNKKKSKKQDNAADANAKETLSDKNESSMEIEEKAEAKAVRARSFPNGLVIEELGMGKPTGKRASPGKKVSVHYIGKLKKNGKIFDSNIGRAPFKFRLGVGQVIKGWDVGVNGMRIGDKRRLTIPPAMGYGARGAGGAIPPNSWLVFDVELVDVN